MKIEINESMKEDQIEDFRKRMFEGEVKFVFRKKSGELREARGTLNRELMTKMDKDEAPAGELKKSQRLRDPHQVCFYDLDAQDKVADGEGKKCWRSFKIESFIGVED